MPLLEFYEYLYARQKIWHKKEILGISPPWTADPILQKYKFCCNYRECDAASQALIKHVINTKSILEDKIFNIIMFRFFNRADFFDKAMPPRHSKTFRAYDWNIEGYKKNDAIHVTGRMFVGHSMTHQILMTMEHVGKCINTITTDIDKARCLENYFKVVKRIRGIGPFLAYQIAQDIGYIEEMKPWDLNEFVYVGPGAIAGLKLLSLHTDAIHTYNDRCQYLFEMQGALLPPQWNAVYYKPSYYKSQFLSLGNIQHSLCEFRKWVNLTNGKGRKRYYKGV